MMNRWFVLREGTVPVVLARGHYLDGDADEIEERMSGDSYDLRWLDGPAPGDPEGWYAMWVGENGEMDQLTFVEKLDQDTLAPGLEWDGLDASDPLHLCATVGPGDHETYVHVFYLKP